MVQYGRIEVSERIDITKISASKECMLCHYWILKILVINLNLIFGMVVMIYW